MTKPKVSLAAVLAATTLALSACGGGGDTDTSADSGSSSESSTVSDEFNDADVSFAQDMIVHHQQAIEMAQLATDRAESDEVKELAADIEAAQAPEIDTFTAWLEAWGEEAPMTGDMEGMEGMDHGDMDMGGMEGGMSEEDMAMLEESSGAEFDQMFLEMMIEHHQGAIEMAQVQQEEGENPEAIALAEKIEQDQTAEIEKMESML